MSRRLFAGLSRKEKRLLAAETVMDLLSPLLPHVERKMAHIKAKQLGVVKYDELIAELTFGKILLSASIRSLRSWM